MSKEEYFKFNRELCGVPDRKGSVADYWRSLDKEKLVEFLCEQCHFTDYFLEQRDKLEKRVNDLSRDRRKLEKENERLREIVKAVAHVGIDWGYGKFELTQEHIDKARELYKGGQGE